MYLFAFLLLVIAVIFIILLEFANDYTKLNIPEFICNDDVEVTKLEAYIDITNEIESGKMGCYCDAYISMFAPWKFFSIQFSNEAQQIGKGNDRYRYCLIWKLKDLAKTIFNYIYLSSAVIVNGIIA